jgi:NitT/TauT family transport system substrate-binding protein
MKPKPVKAAVLSLLLLMLFSCSRPEGPLRIAEQYGLAYAPLTIARELGFMDEALREAGLSVKVEWLRLGNTASIREAAVAGRVDAAFMGIPPFLISRNGGMSWRIASGLNRSPLGLVSWREDIESLEDLDRNDRIALPQPGSIQHMLLAMAAERITGSADRFDRQLVTLNHPDGMQALLARREITAHFTSPPYLFLELDEPGMREVISGEECFGGDFTFIISVTTEELFSKRPKVYGAFLAGLEKGMDYVRTNPEESARLLAPIYGMEAGLVEAMLTAPGMVYEEQVLGVESFAAFMKRAGYLPEEFASGPELFWEESP